MTVEALDSPIGQDKDPVALRDRRHPMSDNHNGDVALQSAHRVLKTLFGVEVERARRLIQNEQAGRAGKRAGDAQSLLLSTGQRH